MIEDGEECDDGNTDSGDGCNAQCQDEVIENTNVRLRGEIRDRKYATPRPLRPLRNVDLRLIGVECTDNSATGPCVYGPTDETGLYAIPGVPIQSTFVVQMHYEETYGPPENPHQYQVAPGFTTRTRAQTYDEAEQNLDLYVIKYRWLSQVAYECGVYGYGDDGNYIYDPTDSPNAALGNPDWIHYSAVLGQLKSQDGSAYANIPKERLEVELGGYVNNNPNYICFLERYDPDPNQEGDEYLRGTEATVSNQSGYFAVFKVKNGPDGTGVGTQYIRVRPDGAGANFEEVSVPVQAGNVSLVTLYADPNAPPPPPVLVDFEEDIVPIFTTYGCVACHTQGGPGAVYADPVQQTYPAVFDGTPDEIYANLTAPGRACGAPQNNEREPGNYRVCVDYPKRSLLAVKPLLEDPPNHPNASFFDKNDPTLLLIEAWAEQGALRYAEPPEPPPVVYSLEGVMNEVAPRGCTFCHGYNTGYPGGLALDGCIQGLIDDGTYANAGIDTNLETNPHYKRDCVHYHLKNQGVDNDPYGYRYRVNPQYPERSMLLRNPYCGRDFCANDEYPETYPVRVFPATDDPGYVAIKSWIEAGALNNSDADLQE